jgi:hypothetical protein
MIVRRAAIVVGASLLALIAVSVPAAAQSSRNDVAVHGTSQAVNVWWVEIQPEYLAFEHAVTGVGTSVQSAIGAASITPVEVACKQLVASAKALRQQPPAPDTAIKERWQAGVNYYLQGASLCVQGTATKQTTRLLGRALRDIKTGKEKLEVATALIKVLTTKH